MPAPFVDAFSETEDLREFKEAEYWEAVQDYRKGAVTEARKMVMQPGDEVTLETPGGGGYGQGL